MNRIVLYWGVSISCIFAQTKHMVEYNLYKSLILRNEDISSGIIFESDMQMYFDHIFIKNCYMASVFKCYFMNNDTKLYNSFQKEDVIFRDVKGLQTKGKVSIFSKKSINPGAFIDDDRDLPINVSSVSQDWYVYDISSVLNFMIVKYLNFKLYVSIAACEMGIYNFIQNHFDVKTIRITIDKNNNLKKGKVYRMFIEPIEDNDVLSILNRSINIGAFASFSQFFGNYSYCGLDIGFLLAARSHIHIHDIRFLYQMSDLKSISIQEAYIDRVFDRIDMEMHEGKFVILNDFRASMSIYFGSRISDHISISNSFRLALTYLFHNMPRLDSKTFSRQIFGYGLQISYGRL
ncbi:MAG: hypothetical protein KAH32_06275 [Chlamydiia bacterium]|nr:hypothetical protein [Chlamydiia bacterium]